MERGLVKARRTFSSDGNGRLEVRATTSGRVRSVPLLDGLRPWLDARPTTRTHSPASSAGRSIRGTPAPRRPETRRQIATPADGSDVRFHDLRHTFLSRLTRPGIHARQPAKVRGHASITTTDLHTRSSAVEAALAVRDQVSHVSREVTLQGSESAQNRRLTGTSDR